MHQYRARRFETDAEADEKDVRRDLESRADGDCELRGMFEGGRLKKAEGDANGLKEEGEEVEEHEEKDEAASPPRRNEGAWRCFDRPKQQL